MGLEQAETGTKPAHFYLIYNKGELMSFRFNCDYCNKDITDENQYKVETNIQNLKGTFNNRRQFKIYCKECFINNAVSEARDFRKECEEKYGIKIKKEIENESNK